jgi:hypothetical protein
MKSRLLLQYSTEVAGLALNRENLRFANSSSAHAQVILEYIFKTAQTNVCVFTGSASEAIYAADEVVEAAREFLARNNTVLEIKSDAPGTLDRTLNRLLYEMHADTKLKGQLLVHLEPVVEKHNYFCVADNRMYRLETNDGQSTAVANFNEPLLAETLRQRFSLL